MIELKGKIGKYKILKKLGSGGFGTVYLAEDTFLKTLRALKIPHGSSSQSEKILQESILQSKLLDHPNIVKLLTVDIVDRTVIMVMEYINGTDLEKLIDEQDHLTINTALQQKSVHHHIWLQNSLKEGLFSPLTFTPQVVYFMRW
jgi:serine/threonine-protein kinase